MKIQTYAIGSIPPEGPHNFLQNKMQFSFFIRRFPGNIIDPRAGRFEVGIRTKEDFGPPSFTEFVPLVTCEGEYIESQIDFIQTGSLSLWKKSLCLPPNMYAKGLLQ